MGPLLALTLAAGGAVPWQPWDQALFARAKAEHRLVLLDLHAVWCHWCHVMEATTYANPEVATLLGDHFLAARVDQDADPALAARYGDWGWPATIVFAADGTEIVKRRGFIPPDRMIALLRAIVADPSPGPSVVAQPAIASGPGKLSAQARAAARDRIDAAYDPAHGGWGNGHKLVQEEELELAIGRALAGDAAARAQVTLTLDGLRRIIDPIWGGLYQYSDADDWSSPHFERLLTVQAAGLRTFALAYAAFHDQRDLHAAREIVRYVDRFLTGPSGAFYTSQDADLSETVDGKAYASLPDTQRVALGLPRVDTHIYARDDGLYIAALADFGRLTGDAPALKRAQRAAATFDASPGEALSDLAAMADGWLALYRATGAPEALNRVRQLNGGLVRFRRADGVGFTAAIPQGPVVGVLAEGYRDVEENATVARVCNALARLTADDVAKTNAEAALRFLTSPQVLDRPALPSPSLLADEEAERPPLHVVVVGPPASEPNQALLAEARAAPTFNLDVEGWDPAAPHAGEPPQVPPAPLGVAYVCGPSFCSPPARTVAALKASVLKQLGR